MVGSVGVVVIVLAYLRWQERINFGVASAVKWVFKFVVDPKTCKVAETCCSEVAVLWFVFPLLDTIYEHGKHPDDPLLHQAYWVSAMFFIFAVIISHVAGRQDKEE